MRSLSTLFLLLLTLSVRGSHANIIGSNRRPVSANVFESLEELARLVDVSYCVGNTGIQRPFQCLSRCHEFPGFELITTWNTGPLLSDSCGYIAISHEPFEPRVLVVFRGTYSIANTIADLSTKHADFVPFPVNGSDRVAGRQVLPKHDSSDRTRLITGQLDQQNGRACQNCTVHTGFWTSWQNTRSAIVPHVEAALERHPGFKLVLVGHSLGGAVAAIAALEFQARGYKPFVTTFGEPRIGNRALNHYVDKVFELDTIDVQESRFRRVTHVGDPVPLLPLEEWGYHMHAGEIFIPKPALPPGRNDLQHCRGDQDPECIAGRGQLQSDHTASRSMTRNKSGLWELFFAHRDYFWRLGLCVPLSDPWHWKGQQLAIMRDDYDDLGH